MADDPKVCCRCGSPLGRELGGGLCAACLIEDALPAAEGWAAAASQSADVNAPFIQRLGDYELSEEIGRGGMGVIYKARQAGLDRVVALKLLLAGEFADTKARQRFVREARIAARLAHPGIVTIHEVGEHQGRPYFAMEYVPGPNLAQLCRNGLLPMNTAARYVEQLARAVHYAHQHGVIHRDLKPANILVTPDNEPKLTDFGLTKSLVDPTRTLESAGSPNFMAPEQADSTLGPTGTATDVFGLGAVLYFLLTGRPPAVGESLSETLRAVVACEPVAPRQLRPALPRDLETIALRCLEREPTRRYASAREVAEELARWRYHEPIRARRATPVDRLTKWVRRRPMVAGLAATLTLSVVAGLGATVWQARRAVRAADQARANELAARHQAYAADLALANVAAEQERWGELEVILNRTRPKPGEPDLRGWEWRYLWGLSRPDLATRLGPVASNRVVSVAALPDGKTWAFGLREGGFVLWDLSSRRSVYTHPEPINRIQVPISTKGEWAATRLCAIPGTGWLAYTDCRGTNDSHVRIWDITTRSVVRSLPLPWIPRHLAVSADGRRLACSTMSADGRVYVFEVATGRLIQTLSGVARSNYSAGNTLAFSPDGGLLTLDDHPGHVRVVEVASGRDRLRLPQGEDFILGAGFSPDGRWLAVGSGFVTNRVRVWDTQAGKLEADLPTGWLEPETLQFDSAGRRLLAGPWIWSVPDFKVERRLNGEGRFLRTARLGGDDRTYLLEGQPGWLLAGDLAEQPPLRGRTLIEGVGDWTGFVNSRGLTFVGTNGIVHEARPPHYRPTPFPDLGTNCTTVDAWPEGNLLAVGRRDGRVTLHALDSRQLRGEFSLGAGPAAALALLPQAGRLIVRDPQNNLQVWALDPPVRCWQVPLEILGATRYLHRPSGRLFEAFLDGRLTIIDLIAQQVEHRQLELGVISGVATSEDGRHLLVVPHEGNPWVLDAHSLAAVGRFDLANFVAHRGVFWPDGLRCALSGVGVRVMDVASRRLLLKLQTDFGFGTYVVTSPDGNDLFQLGGYQQICVWHVPSWEEIRRAEAATGR
jgi:predicted Ser/Thr protein kinase